MRLTRFSFSLVLAGIALLAAVGTADAAIRYASPSSSATSGLCTVVTPCRLDYAISSAGGGDTVELAAGTYAVTYPVAASAAVNVAGALGQARPQIVGDPSRTAATIDLSFGGSLKHVYVESQTANPAVNAKGAVIEDVLASSASGAGIQAKAGSGATIRDSVIHTTGTTSALVLTDDQVTGNLDVVNVTAIATGVGATAISNGSGGVVSIVNTIARGNGGDIKESTPVQDAQVSYSNYNPATSTGVIAGAGNQTGAPVFSDGLYRVAAGSPTIDSGTASIPALGSFDPDGNLRLLGGVPDIGAYEYVVGAGSPDPGAGTGSSPTGTTTPTGGNDRPGGTDPDPVTELPPSARPVLGRNVDLGPVSGTVRVTLPGSGEAVVLDDGANVPVGSVIDATNGVVSLTSARDSNGETQTGRFWGGAFKVGQSRKGDQYTVLTLVGDLACGARGKVTAAGRRSARRLWGSDNHGHFRTRGRRGQATVRGTQWLTEDRCNGTFFKVKQGAIVVRDFARKRSVKLTPGERYLARKR